MSKVSEIESKIRSCESELRAQKRKLEDLERAIRTAENDVKESESTIDKLKRELSDAEHEERREAEKAKVLLSKYVIIIADLCV